MELGEKIQISRKKKGMSQEDLANVLNVSRQAVQKWESGVSNPELNKVIELGRVLDVSLDWLLDEDKMLKEEAVVEEETEDSLEEKESTEEETPTEEEQENPTHKETPVLEKPKRSFKKILIIGSIALLLIGGTAAAITIAVNAKKQVDMPFLDREGNAFLVEGYEGTKEIDGVSYAFGKVGADKSMYIIGVETTNPSFMAEYNGYVLKDMLFETFSDRRDYVSVTVPDWSIFQTINAKTLSFKGCTKLEKVKLPEGLLLLGGFGGCASLSEIDIPDTVDELEPFTFENCTSLKSITIPEDVRVLPRLIFSNCQSLTEVNFVSTIKTIDEEAFKGCTSLKEITLPRSLSSLGKYAFMNCTSLESIVIPQGIDAINDCLFCDCSGLKSVSIPQSAREIKQSSFSGCSSLENITYNGTIEEWASITQSTSNWSRVPTNVVHCSNGDAPLHE